jgi:hypothetical protein
MSATHSRSCTPTLCNNQAQSGAVRSAAAGACVVSRDPDHGVVEQSMEI